MRFLSIEHIEYLKSDDTLLLWSGKTLEQRCVLFHRHFGNHSINPTLLRKIYALHKIRRKHVKFTKDIDPDKESEYEVWRLDLKDKISSLKEEGYKIVYLDEAVFTTKTIKKTDYSPLKTYHRIP